MRFMSAVKSVAVLVKATGREVLRRLAPVGRVVRSIVVQFVLPLVADVIVQTARDGRAAQETVHRYTNNGLATRDWA